VDFAASINNLSNRLVALKKFRFAYRFGKAALAVRQGILGNEEVFAAQAEVAVSFTNLSAIASYLEEPEDALEYAKEAVRIRRWLQANGPEAFETKLASSLSNLSFVLYELSFFQRAICASKEAIELLSDAFLSKPSQYASLISRPLKIYTTSCALIDERVEVALVSPIIEELRQQGAPNY